MPVDVARMQHHALRACRCSRMGTSVLLPIFRAVATGPQHVIERARLPKCQTLPNLHCRLCNAEVGKGPELSVNRRLIRCARKLFHKGCCRSRWVQRRIQCATIAAGARLVVP